ncbi:MAG: hypothetical protein EOP09_01225 [Proteobacteria bacterium]|nr:MAG: hypothetical protein EOP09_01225 [Pseudomonadota bacterium]
MIARKLLRLLTLSSFLPLASCATPDDVASPLNAESGNAPINDAKLNQSIEGAVESNANTASANSGNQSNNALANNSGSSNLNEDDDGSMNEGDEDFDNETSNENSLANNTGGPAANVEGDLGGFEDNLAAEEFLDNPAPSTANVAATNAAAAAAGNEAINAFKNTATEQNAFASNASGNISTENLAPNAAPVANAVPAAAPAPVAQAALPAPVQAPPAPPVAIGRDVESTPSTLHWVGYRINETMKKLNLEIVTIGRPEYEIFETTNRSNQSELILRFYHTQLRKKIKWDVNSSEFRSPVAYIRMKNREAEGVVDLVITHRDKVSPGFYEKAGNFILSYDIPQRYFNELDLAKGKVKDRAVSLKIDQSAPLAKPKTVASKLPVVGVPRYMTAIREEPKFRPIRSFISPKRIRNAKDGFPESFDKTPILGRRTGEIISRSTLFGVAQDNLENNFENESAEGNANINGNGSNNLNNNSGNAATNNFNNTSVGSNLNSGNASSNSNNATNNGSNLENALEEDVSEGGFNDEASPDAFSNLEDKSAAPSSLSNEGLTPAANSASAPASNALPSVTPGEDVEPEEAGGKAAKYTGKPIFMEFYDSPLSLVLKGFSEETGNNFVYSSEIGETPITIQFKGVPWDEALKAILETYTLGMVRIGENVVRIDRIQNLTSYMQALEQAKQFETRRLPTKVLVFRLNNGVAKDVADRVKELLSRDTEIDNRIKLSEDERTNSVVIEAPVNVLAKAKAIIERLDLDTPQVEIMSRIVEVRKDDNEFTGVAWGNNVNFDPGRALGFGTLNFPNSAKSNFSVDPGVGSINTAGAGTIRLGSLNKFLDLDLFLKLEEKKGKTNVLQSNRVLVLDGRKATVTAGSSQFFRPAAGGNVINPAPGAGGGRGGEGNGLSEITFNLSLEVTPQVTALGNVIMNLDIQSDTPGATTGEQLASKGTRRLTTQMVRQSGDTGVIGGIYDTKRSNSTVGVPFLSDLPIIGALFRSTTTSETQTELLMMVTPTIMNGSNKGEVANSNVQRTTVISQKQTGKKGSL